MSGITAADVTPPRRGPGMRIALPGAVAAESLADEPLVAWRVGRTDERALAPPCPQDPRGARRHRGKRTRLDPSDDRELVPGAPHHALRGARPQARPLGGEVPLDDQ